LNRHYPFLSALPPFSASILSKVQLDETIKVWDLELGECLATWKSLHPYEGMQIDKIQGLTEAQKSTLQALGAIAR
jgi:hypothetical protein